jgi:RES domain-containing protein
VTGFVSVWRLSARRLGSAVFSGEGAFKYGGRWNRRGTRVVYCAQSRALAAMELLVHVEDSGDLASVEWLATEIIIPWFAIERPVRYPDSWRIYPYPEATQNFGSRWAQAGRSVALRVPSAVVPGEFNYLLNPAHADFRTLKRSRPEKFPFDPRLRSRT